MAGMLQIITYLLCFYLVIKGIEILQIGISSSRPSSRWANYTWRVGIGCLYRCRDCVHNNAGRAGKITF